MEKEKFRKKAQKIAENLTNDELISLLTHDSKEIGRLGINRYNWWNEASHGVARNGTATVFPCPTALAASFDDALVGSAAEIISDEARAKYNIAREKGEYDIYKGLTFWSPNINIYRDPRWGRGQETFGEDPFLTATLAKAYIKGLQGDKEFYKTSALAKHFAVHSGPEGSRHEFNAEISLKDLYETYLPAFEKAVEAGVSGIMCAYNSLLGEPCCASEMLIGDILRGKWGFDGYVMADNYALNDIHGGHGFTKNAVESAALALRRGIDLDCGDVFLSLPGALEEGLVSRQDLERAASKLLEIRASLGEFEDTPPFSDIGREKLDSRENAALNLKAAESSLVLLENKNGSLPLKKEKAAKIAVVGPLASSRAALEGNYNGHASEYITVVDGIRRTFPDSEIYYAEGSSLILEDKTSIFGFGDMISEGAAAAKDADVCILCLGLDATLEGEESSVDNEIISRGDRKKLSLPETQKRLARAVLDASDNVIIVTFCGGCIDISDEIRSRAAAHIHAWYPGALGGLAVAKLIAGEFSPTGRLPLTFYREDAHLPDFEDYSMEKRTYRFSPCGVLYPFGYGLSFEKVSISDVVTDSLSQSGADVSFTVKNESENETSKKLCVWAKFTDSRCRTPEKQLVALCPVTLSPNESKRICARVDGYWYHAVTDTGERIFPDGSITFSVD